MIIGSTQNLINGMPLCHFKINGKKFITGGKTTSTLCSTEEKQSLKILAKRIETSMSEFQTKNLTITIAETNKRNKIDQSTLLRIWQPTAD